MHTALLAVVVVACSCAIWSTGAADSTCGGSYVLLDCPHTEVCNPSTNATMQVAQETLQNTTCSNVTEKVNCFNVTGTCGAQPPTPAPAPPAPAPAPCNRTHTLLACPTSPVCDSATNLTEAVNLEVLNGTVCQNITRTRSCFNVTGDCKAPAPTPTPTPTPAQPSEACNATYTLRSRPAELVCNETTLEKERVVLEALNGTHCQNMTVERSCFNITGGCVAPSPPAPPSPSPPPACNATHTLQACPSIPVCDPASPEVERTAREAWNGTHCSSVQESRSCFNITGQCPAAPCPNSWAAWGTCSAPCGGGRQTRVRLGAAPAACPTEQEQACNKADCGTVTRTASRPVAPGAADRHACADFPTSTVEQAELSFVVTLAGYSPLSLSTDSRSILRRVLKQQIVQGTAATEREVAVHFVRQGAALPGFSALRADRELGSAGNSVDVLMVAVVPFALRNEARALLRDRLAHSGQVTQALVQQGMTSLSALQLKGDVAAQQGTGAVELEPEADSERADPWMTAVVVLGAGLVLVVGAVAVRQLHSWLRYRNHQPIRSSMEMQRL